MAYEWYTTSAGKLSMRLTPAPSSEMPRANVGVAAYEQLRAMLLSGALAGGCIIQERRLAEELGISRTPIREALQRLEGEGLLQRQDRFLRVTNVTVTEVMEILAVRLSLESEAARAACGRMPPALLRNIRARIKAMTNPGTVRDDAHWAVDDLVHLSIARQSGNGLLLRLVSDLRQKTRLFGLHRIPSRFGPGKIEHLAILDALEAGDAELAADRMRVHINHAREAILNALAMGRG
jgi:DNA-binding GntR family transcriptional regulator